MQQDEEQMDQRTEQPTNSTLTNFVISNFTVRLGRKALLKQQVRLPIREGRAERLRNLMWTASRLLMYPARIRQSTPMCKPLLMTFHLRSARHGMKAAPNRVASAKRLTLGSTHAMV